MELLEGAAAGDKGAARGTPGRLLEGGDAGPLQQPSASPNLGSSRPTSDGAFGASGANDTIGDDTMFPMALEIREYLRTTDRFYSVILSLRGSRGGKEGCLQGESR